MITCLFALYNSNETVSIAFGDFCKKKTKDHDLFTIPLFTFPLFDGKITFAEGYPSIVERTITVDEEYERAVSAINKLIEKYI